MLAGMDEEARFRIMHEQAHELVAEKESSPAELSNPDAAGKRKSAKKKKKKEEEEVISNICRSTPVPSAAFGVIIGRQGVSIRLIQNEYSVRIHLNRNRCKAIVIGEVEGNVKCALNYIRDKVFEWQTRTEHRCQQQLSVCAMQPEQTQPQQPPNEYVSLCQQKQQQQVQWHQQQHQQQQQQWHQLQWHQQQWRQQQWYQQPWHQQLIRSKFQGKMIERVQHHLPMNWGNYYPTTLHNFPTTSPIRNSFNWRALNPQAVEAIRAAWQKLPPIKKDFYCEAEEVAQLSVKQVTRIREDNYNTWVHSDDPNDSIPNPIWKFEHCFSNYPDIMGELYNQNFEEPYPIQAQAWPILMKGRDMIGIAQTGTGKTLAFLLPALLHIRNQVKAVEGASAADPCAGVLGKFNGPQVLIVVPTRELVYQIDNELKRFCWSSSMVVCVLGGCDRSEQISLLDKKPEILICTPGRLNDLVEANVIDITNVSYLVLDEADRMLNLGFLPQIQQLLMYIRRDRQTVITTATWPRSVRLLSHTFMTNPIQVCVGARELTMPTSVRHVMQLVEEEDKYLRVKEFVRNKLPDWKVIIFCGKKRRVNRLASQLTADGLKCQSIHGSRAQVDRDQAIEDLVSGAVGVLITTDMFSRGIDIGNITHVFNYDFPTTVKGYIHRIGRTGRAGRTGISISFMNQSNRHLVWPLIEIMIKAGIEVPKTLYELSKTSHQWYRRN